MEYHFEYTSQFHDFREFRRFLTSQERWWYSALRIIGGLYFVWRAVVEAPDSGWSVPRGIHLLIGLWFIFLPIAFVGWFFSLIFVRNRTATVTIDEETVTVQIGEDATEYPWYSFSRYGHAVELDNRFFYLQSGRGGGVFIPNRAFRSEDEMSEFRQFLTGKMGDRFRTVR